MYRKIVSLVILSSFVFYLAGCTSMRYVSPEEVPRVEQKSSVWVIMVDGNQYEVEEPRIEGSRLVGYIEPEGYREIDISKIELIGIKEPDKRKTLKLAAIGLTGAIVLFWILSDSDSDEPSCST